MKLITRIQHLTTKRNFFLSLTITVTTFIIMALITIPFFGLSGGLPPLDMRLHYTIDEVNQLFTALDTLGRQQYSLFQMVDMVFPIALALTLMFILVRIIDWGYEPASRLFLIVFLPLGGAIADYAENILVATQLLSYPVLSPLIITIASSFTTIKWGFIFFTLILVVVLVIWSL